MSNKGKGLFAPLFVMCLVLSLIFLQKPALAQEIKTERLYGSNRYETAVLISQKGWETSDYVILARGDDFPDALCAGPLAKKYDAPILLTETQSLGKVVLNEIKRLKASHVIITGGYGAISKAVEESLIFDGITDVERIYGNDRYETSVKIAERVGGDEAALATGLCFPDALSISSIASNLRMPILLTTENALPENVKQFINNNISKTYVIGSDGVIGHNVVSNIPVSVRIGGKDRYETNILLLEEFSDRLDFNELYIAVGDGPDGDEFADALAGSVLAAKDSAPVILVYKDVSHYTADFLKSRLFIESNIVALGGEKVVSQDVVDSLLNYIGQASIAAIYDKAGTYGTNSLETIDGNVVISSDGVILKNTVIEGDLLLSKKIGNGAVKLENVTVNGSTYVHGGGPNSVVMINFNGENVIVDVPEGSRVRLVAQGDTTIDSVTMESDGKLEELGVTGEGFIGITIPNNASVVLSGDFDEISVQGRDADICLDAGTIRLLDVEETSTDAIIRVMSGAVVTSLDIKAPAEILGPGTVVTIYTSCPGVRFDQPILESDVTNNTPTVISDMDNSGTIIVDIDGINIINPIITLPHP